MFAYFDVPISWGELARRTFKEMQEDDGFGLAAQLAYYFFLALFPALLCAIALASFLPLQNFTDDVVTMLGRFAPEQMLSIVEEQMLRLAESDNGGLVSIGLLGALAGVILGYGLARAVRRSIRGVQVRVRDAAGRLDPEAADVTVSDDGDFGGLHADLDQLSERVGTGWSGCTSGSGRCGGQSSWPPSANWRRGWRTRSATRSRPSRCWFSRVSR